MGVCPELCSDLGVSFLEITVWSIIRTTPTVQYILASTGFLAILYGLWDFPRKLRKLRDQEPNRPPWSARSKVFGLVMVRMLLIAASPIFLGTMVVHRLTEWNLVEVTGGYASTIAFNFLVTSAFIVVAALAFNEIKRHSRRRIEKYKQKLALGR